MPLSTLEKLTNLLDQGALIGGLPRLFTFTYDARYSRLLLAIVPSPNFRRAELKTRNEKVSR